MHLMYVDESGDNGYPAAGQPFPSTGGPTRWYVRVGVIIHSWQWAGVHDRICQFKTSRFLKWDDEIKANSLRAGKDAFASWRPPDRAHFLNDFLDTIGREMDVSILSIHIDKSKVDTTRRDRLTNPSVRSLELLLELYNNFLGIVKDRTGAVILDSINAKDDGNLRYFQNYLRTYSNNLDHRRIVDGTFFLPSNESTFLQVADVCSNVLYVNKPSEVARIADRRVGSRTWP
jgi:hypothetical protein